MIAAHSQGAPLLAQRLLNKKINNTKVQERFICAYVIGYMIPEKCYDDLLPRMSKCLKHLTIQIVLFMVHYHGS